MTTGIHHARNSNLELLRILAMLLIVANHFATKGGIPWKITQGTSLSGNLLFSQFLASLGKFGVDLFVLVSAWFMVGKAFNFCRIAKVWITTVVFGVGTLLFVLLTGTATITLSDFTRLLFPITNNAYWFVTTYVPFISILPFVLDGCNRLSPHRHGITVGGLLLVYSVLPTVLGPFGYGTKPLWGYSELLWFIILGIVAAYLRRTIDTTRISLWKPTCGLILTFVAIASYTVICDMLKVSGHAIDWSLWRHANSTFIVIAACSCLILFVRMNLGANRIINAIASGSFGVYLIHDHPKLSRIIWHNWIDVPALYGQDWYCIRALWSILLIFSISLAISVTVTFFLSPLMRRIESLKTGDIK